VADCGCAYDVLEMAEAMRICDDAQALVSVVDDDESVRESLPDLLTEFGTEFGFAAQGFASAEEYLASNSIDQTRCLVLDVAMPGLTWA
jgi:FixJ family two-component response regulator